MLNPGQNRALNTLQARQSAGTIRQGGLNRLDALRQQQQQARRPKAPPPPMDPGGIPPTGTQPPPPGIPEGPIDPNKPSGTNPYTPTSVDDPTGFNFNADPGAGIPGTTRDVVGTVYQEIGQQFDPAMKDAFNPIDFGALPAAPGTQDLASERQRIEGELYNKYTRDLDEQKAQAYEAKQQELAERGITPGSGKGYEQEMDRFDKGFERQYAEAKQNAVAQGGAEWERTYGIGAQGRQSALGEQQLQRQFPLQQLGQLGQLAQAPAQEAVAYRGQRVSKQIARRNRKSAERIAKIQAEAAKAVAHINASAAKSKGGGGDTGGGDL